jgi:hypothetical protein
MSQLSPREIFLLAVLVLTVAILLVQISRLTALRRPGVTAASIVLAGPFLFIYPERYFLDGRGSAPWRMLGWFVSWVVLVGFLARYLHV